MVNSYKIEHKLLDLCEQLTISYNIEGDSNCIVTGLQLDSRRVKSGDVFFCINGLKQDGHDYAKSAVENGAVCLFVERILDNIDVCQVLVKNARVAMAEVADLFYGQPSKKMNVIGITGTNGKTTTSNIVSHVLNSCNQLTAVIGTIGVKINNQIVDPEKFSTFDRTTPESIDLQKLLYELNAEKVQNVVMEVSSHSLSQNRVSNINFAVTAFINLSQDHLDYHKNMKNYFDAKAMLFTSKFYSKRVICIDDEWGKKLSKKCLDAGDDVLTCGLCDEAQFNLNNVNVNFPLLGDFNKQNMIIAYGICKSLNLKHDDIANALESMPNVEGRMQLVDSDENKPKVIVDFAHTPDALKNVIITLKDIYEKKITTVFGCGGDRDKDKRPKMGMIASKYSDYCIVTSDNPRSENKDDIINDIVFGMKENNNYEICADRSAAIKSAIENSSAGDIVLIAGKGHEKNQTIGNMEYYFDDVEEAKKWLRDK